MKLDGRRESSNVEDRRKMSGGTKAGLGLGGIIMAIAIAYFTNGGNLAGALQTGIGQAMQQSQNVETYEGEEREFTQEEQEAAKFASQILAGTEDVWTKVFESMGKTYEAPKMVLFTNAVSTACGSASSSVGPFYCSGDQALYIDLSFFTLMKNQMGAGGDLAYAYVIAHEVGHHVEYLLGILNEGHTKMARLGNNSPEANKVSQCIELMADYYAGVWAHFDNQMFGSLEDGDIENAINCASKIGDDYLQKKAQGYTQPESFNHGTSAMRMKWLKKGLNLEGNKLLVRLPDYSEL